MLFFFFFWKIYIVYVRWKFAHLKMKENPNGFGDRVYIIMLYSSLFLNAGSISGEEIWWTRTKEKAFDFKGKMTNIPKPSSLIKFYVTLGRKCTETFLCV